MKETKRSQNPHNSQNTHNSENLYNSQNPKNSLNPQKISTNPSIEKRKETDNQRNEVNIQISQSKLENELNQPENNKEILTSNNLGNRAFNNEGKEDILQKNQGSQTFSLSYKNGLIKDDKLKNNDNEEFTPNSIGKLCFDPLTLFVYDSKKKFFPCSKI